MAYVNVRDWNVDQVTDWLKGLDSAVSHYTTSFLNNGVTGGQLLNLRADDLEHLGVKILGHQEIILEAVEHLRHFHYELDKENLQTLALKLSCAANSLYRELLTVEDDCRPFKSQTLSDVHNIISAIKPLVFWLDRAPFAGDKDYMDCKTQMLQLAFEMATNAHRDIFSEQPVVTIRRICEKLTKMADHIIQDISDPMILQPASLDLATLKKKEQELGFFILPSNHAIHQIADIKFGSPAHTSTKIEEGDEIVQVNYMTVVGWQRKNVMFLLQESPPEIVLTLKKRPRHTKVYGQIYMKPYRLPSKKRGQPYSRWNESLPSPVLLPIPDLRPLRIEKIPPVDDPVDSGNEISESYSDTESPPDSLIDSGTRLYPIKPISNLQRRNTFNGGTSTSMLKSFSIEQCREMLKNQAATPSASSNHINSNSNFEEDSKCLRDKSASCSVGLELSPRPTTVIGLSSKKSSFKKSKCSKRVNFDDEKIELNSAKSLKLPDSNLNEEKSLSLNSLSGVNEASVDFIDEGKELTDRSSMTSGWQKEIVEELIESIKSKPSKLAPPPPPPLPQDEQSPKDKEEDIKTENTRSLKDDVLNEVKVNVHDIIKKLDKQSAQTSTNIQQKPKVLPRSQVRKITQNLTKPVVPPRSITTVITTTKLRGRLDKSHSTPAYDISEEIKPVCEVLKEDVGKNEKLTIENEDKNTTIKKEIETVVEAVKFSESETINETETISEITRSYEKTEKIKITELRTIKKSPSKEVLTNETKSIDKDGSIDNKLDTSLTELPPSLPDSSSNTVTGNDELALLPSETEKPTDWFLEEQDVLPPKPPPRTFGIVDLHKPAYPADSPKPTSFIEMAKPVQPSVNTPPRAPPRIFEFPETKLHNLSQHNTLKEDNTETFIPRNDNKLFPEEKSGKQFEPKSVSTPLNKTRMEMHDHEPPSYKNSSMLEINKSDKVSPTNSMIRAMIYSKSKPKRKNLIAKRRKVTVNDLSPPDIQGWLYQRLRMKQTQNVSWERRWFVLLGNCLYGYKSKDDPRAACLIFLSGFTVAVASEVKSRTNAFKVYHTGTVFYFSADDHETLQCWIDLITAATLLAENSKTNDGILFSETDDSDTEKSKNSEKQNSDSLKKFGSLKKFSSKKSSNATQDGSTSLDRKWFFNKSSSQSKNALPVPTAQFRSYRKIRATEPHSESVTTGNFTSHVPFFVPPMEKQHMKNISVPNLSVDPVPNISITDNVSKLPMKSKPTNYIHASNPSLCNTHDLIVPSTYIKKSYKPHNDNLAGFVTLEELMIRQTEERKKNPHAAFEDPAPINLNLIKPDVVYGEVPIRPKDKKEKDDGKLEDRASHKKSYKSDKTSSSNVYYPKNHLEESPESSSESSSSCFGKRLGSLKKNQKSNIEYDNKTATYPKITKGSDKKMNSSLPRMHKLQEKYREEDTGIQYFSDRNLASAKFGERSYEMIYCPETITETVQFAQNRSLGNVDNSKKTKIKKQHSFSSSDKKTKSEKSLFFDTPRYHKISDSSTSRIKLKSAMQYTPMSLPLTQDPKSRPKFAFELNLDEKSSKSSGKLKQIFGKQQSDQKKEKTFLGSPKLHRAIFKKCNTSNPLDATWPIATQIVLQDNSYLIPNLSPVVSEPALPPSLPAAPHPDYPGLEYPPVFEPETYSLADPQSSLSILRKQGK
ncbi:uncharacterized protein LOC123677516 isoform X2 [Harmonia axyridis]|uniref:uncharacterized protein LOC123677516 isoform X2 n=1 Tax=Harmonia axyridis TaxID=115357 RepID=UPI001E2777B6|nr:uncharacterized protein LOC123677516 isoform X2 [Harmonia axyridis]